MTKFRAQHTHPSWGTELDGGLALFWCARRRRGVQAATVDMEPLEPGQRGRAA
jgi:hypothetical protein